MASRILDIIGMAFSPVLEAVFDEMECRFARRAILEAARSKAEMAVHERRIAHELAHIEQGRRA